MSARAESLVFIACVLIGMSGNVSLMVVWIAALSVAFLADVAEVVRNRQKQGAA